MENAEVLEMTVKRVESILQNKAKGKSCFNIKCHTGLKRMLSVAFKIIPSLISCSLLGS